MVDYNIGIPQQQYFQAPDLMQNAMRMQQMQVQNMQMQQAERTQQQQNAMAAHLSGGGDMSTPEFRQKLLAVGGASAAPLLASIATMQKENLAARAEEARTARYQSQARASDFETQVKERKEMLDRLPYIMTLDDPNAYLKFRSEAVKKFGPGITLPETKPTEKEALALYATASDALKQAQDEWTAHTTEGGPVFTNKKGQFKVGTEVSPTGTPLAGDAPVAGGEAKYLTGLNKAEGTGKNPNSSATGKYQFVDGTFVDTARKAFPALADKPASEILALRGTRLPNGGQIEDVLEQTLRANNTQALTSAGIAPTPGNTYLAHFLGAGGARNLLSVDPNTPVSQILDPRAIAANKSVLEGKTAGEVAAWANSKFGGAPGLAASMTAGNQRLGGVDTPNFIPAMGGGMSPAAPTMNNAMALGLMGQQPPPQGNALAAPMLQPQIAQPQAAPALSPYQQQQKDARERALMQTEERTAAMERGKTSVREATETKARRETAGRVLQILNDPELDKLVENSTSGTLAYGLEATKGGVTGKSTTGMENIGRLATIQEALLFRLANGKLGGGFTDKDSDTIRGMLGRIADPNTPANVRIKTLQDVRAMMSSVATGENMVIAPAAVEEPKPSARRNMKSGDTSTKKPDSLAHFMTAAKKANPNVSDSDLEAYYNKTYGGR